MTLSELIDNREVRGKATMSAIRDPEIKAIIATRGGNGCIGVLKYLSINGLHQNPKWVIGYSDVTNLLTTMLHSGVMCVHGNMCKELGRKEGYAKRRYFT